MNHLKKSMAAALCFTLFAGLAPVTVNAEGGGSFPHEETGEAEEGGTYKEYETKQKEKASDKEETLLIEEESVKEERVPREGEFQPNNAVAGIDLNLDEMVTVEIKKGGDYYAYIYSPVTDGYYTFRSYSAEGIDPFATLYEHADNSSSQLTYNDDGIPDSYDFRIVYWLEAGHEYIYEVEMASSYDIGTFQIKLSKGGAVFGAYGDQYIEVEAGESATLRIMGIGDTSKASVQWYKGETLLSGETKSSLELKKISSSANYHAHCSDGYEFETDIYFYVTCLLVLQPDRMVTVDIDEPGKSQRYRFVPETEGFYTIRSYSTDCDPKVTLYEQTDDGEIEAAYNDDGIQGSADFRLVYYFFENTVYYFETALYSNNATGSFKIQLIKGGAVFSAYSDTYIEANLHDTVTLQVEGLGDTSKATSQWYCEEEKLEGEVNPALVIKDVTEPHSYICHCDDGYGYSVDIYFYVHCYREIETITWNESRNYEISSMQQYVYFPDYVTVGPNGADVNELSYSSSNEKVLSMESEYPYRAAVQGSGTTTITAYSSKNPSIKSTHKFTVYTPVTPTSMKASGEKNITFYYRYWYNSGVLGVKYSPDHSDTSTTWESSDSSIIGVYGDGEDPGYSFYGTGGPVTVTAKSVANPKLSVKFNITIVDQDAPFGTFDTELEIGKVQNPTDRNPEHSEVNPQAVYMDVGDIYYMKITDSSKTCVPTSQSAFLEETDIIEALVSGSDLYIDNGILYNVFECNIKAMEAGVYTISRNGRATTLVVRDPGASGPSSIDIDKSAAEIATESTLKLNAAVSGQNQDMVVWTSSDPDVAIVDSTGLVTALRYGKATITAASAYNSSVRDTCKIQTRFYDVNDPSKYYYNPVYWAADKGITTGYDRIYFGPQKNCTRQELAIFLWRLAGEPSASGNLPFSDTKYSKTSASYKAILWCSQQGIVKGYSDGTFRPKNNVTRKDTLIMLYRLAGKPSVSGTITFPDVVKENYAPGSDTYKAILWGVQNGITNGYKDGNFQPKTNCLREHIVTFIFRADKVIK